MKSAHTGDLDEAIFIMREQIADKNRNRESDLARQLSGMRHQEELADLERDLRETDSPLLRCMIDLIIGFTRQKGQAAEELEDLAPWKHPPEMVEDQVAELDQRSQKLTRLIAIFQKERQQYQTEVTKRRRSKSKEVRRRRDFVRFMVQEHSAKKGNCLHQFICKELDCMGFRVPNSKPWKTAGAKTWVEGYRNAKIRGSIHKMFSDYAKQPAAHLVTCGKLDLEQIGLPPILQRCGVQTWTEAYLRKDLQTEVEKLLEHTS